MRGSDPSDAAPSLAAGLWVRIGFAPRAGQQQVSYLACSFFARDGWTRFGSPGIFGNCGG